MEDISLFSFGEMLKAYRKRRGLTQQQLAMELNVHQNTVGAWERGNYLPETRSMILELARYLRLNDTEIRQLLDASLTSLSSRWSVPFQRNLFFTGREAILQQIHALYAINAYDAMCRSCSLIGIGGIGKTQIAVEYAYRQRFKYSAIFWIDCASRERIVSDFTTIATILKLPTRLKEERDKLIIAVLDWLNTHRNWLLIFDNVESVEAVRPFLPATPEGSLLFTTRLPTLGTLTHSIELQPMPLQESLHLLVRRAQSQPTYTATLSLPYEEEVAAQTIAIEMDGLPLALDLAGAYIEESRCSFADFLHIFRNNTIDMLQKRSASALYPFSVVETFICAFEELQRKNPVATEVLTLCCFLASDEIPEALLAQVWYAKHVELQVTLSDSLQRNVIFKDLLSYALIRRNTQARTFTIHRLAQAVLKWRVPTIAQREWHELAIRTVNWIFHAEPIPINAERWSLCKQLLPHALFVLEQAEQHQLSSPELDALFQRTTAYLFLQARSTQATLLCQRILTTQEQVLGIERSAQPLSLASQAGALPVGHAQKVFASRAVSLPFPRQQEADPFETFLRECCEFSPHALCRTADLWHAYERWTQEHAKPQLLSRQVFACRLKAAGCSPYRTNSSRMWLGIQLKNR